VTLEEVHFYVAMIGTVAFASAAVLSVAERKVDLFAAVVLGVVSAVGGGTLRDVIVDVPVFWSTETSYLWVASATSVATFFASNFFGKRLVRRLFLYIDAIAVAMFAVEATAKVWHLNVGLPIGPVVLGVVTAIGGGLIRDVLVQRPTLLLSRDLYAVPVLLGCTFYALILTFAPGYALLGSIASILLIFCVRAAAIRWNLQMPAWATMNEDSVPKG